MNDLWCELPDMQAELWQLVAQIPPGSVTTYGALAEALGDRAAARWVGQVLLNDEEAARYPTHRVLRAGGELGAFCEAGGTVEKRRRLQHEGVEVVGERVDLAPCEFVAFEGSRPLTALRQRQEDLRKRLVLGPPSHAVTTVAGVDVSYRGGEAVAAYAVVERRPDRDAFDSPMADGPLWSCVARRPVRFPYISSYLAFRELPVLLDLWQEVTHCGPRPDVVLVDGSGILHPRRLGVAAMFGVLIDWPTIGVTKKRLFGRRDRDVAPGAGQIAAICEDGEQLGWAVWPTTGSERPLYVSPGQRVDLATCRDVVLDCLGERRLPEPIYWADRLSRQAARETTVRK